MKGTATGFEPSLQKVHDDLMDMKMVYEIDGSRFATLEGFYEEISRVLIPGAEWTPLKFKLDPAKHPKVLYATAIEGSDKDKTVPVIYRVDKSADILTLCFDERNGRAVPEDFAATKGSGFILLFLKHELWAPAARAPAAPKQ